MRQRIITAIVAICVLVPILIFSETVALPIGVAVCSMLAVYEMLACIGLKKAWGLSAPLYLTAAVFPFLIRYLPAYRETVESVAFAALAVTALYFFGILIFSHGKYNVSQIGAAYFSVFYILVGMFGLQIVHDWVSNGEYIYLIAFIGAWVTDSFAYFCGMLFGRGGKHKLIPDVSPKKTVEGAIGGTVFCILSMLLFGFIVERSVPEIHADYLMFAVAGLLIAVVAQIGDLAMSVIKRTYGIKDYGKIFPGHGGILDRFDSVIAVSVVLTVLTRFVDLLK